MGWTILGKAQRPCPWAARGPRQSPIPEGLTEVLEDVPSGLHCATPYLGQYLCVPDLERPLDSPLPRSVSLSRLPAARPAGQSPRPHTRLGLPHLALIILLLLPLPPPPPNSAAAPSRTPALLPPNMLPAATASLLGPLLTAWALLPLAQGQTPNYTRPVFLCGGDVTGDSGYVASEGFPNLYPPNKECIWTITVRDPSGHCP